MLSLMEPVIGYNTIRYDLMVSSEDYLKKNLEWSHGVVATIMTD